MWAKLYVGFFTTKPASADVVHLDHERFLPEQFSVSGHEIYMHFARRHGPNENFPDYLNRRLKVPITFRNWNTVNRMLAMSMSNEPDPLPRRFVVLRRRCPRSSETRDQRDEPRRQLLSRTKRLGNCSRRSWYDSTFSGSGWNVAPRVTRVLTIA